jgi:hypothetical protein
MQVETLDQPRKLAEARQRNEASSFACARKMRTHRILEDHVLNSLLLFGAGWPRS